MPHLSTKTSRENLKKQTDTVLSLLAVLRSMDTNTGPPLCTLVHEKNTNLSCVLETLIKSSDNETLRQGICELGVFQVIADLLKQPLKSGENTSSLEVRHHACTLLTNLSVGNTENKKLMISTDGLIVGLLNQLKCPSEHLQRMTAGVLRNLSLNADETSKKMLRNSGIISTLMTSAMKAQEECTLECLLNALWNVSGHSEENKRDICEFPGSLEFLVSLLYRENLAIVENGGGILKNISSYIAVHTRLRQILRQNECFEVLLQHLHSTNIKIVGNACGTLWNLSARCAEDQSLLWKLKAVAQLGPLVTSEHEPIAIASAAALKNLVTFKIYSSASNNSCSEFERYEGKRMGSIQYNSTQPKATRTLGKLNQKLCDYEESLDEPIDFSRRYKESHEQSNMWQSKSTLGEMPAYRPLPYDAAVSKEGHAMLKNFMIPKTNLVKVPAAISIKGLASEMPTIPHHLHGIYQAIKQDFVSGSPPERPKHYCTEDTPDAQSVCRSSVNNISGFNSLDIGHYRNVGGGCISAAEKDLGSNHHYKELVSSSPKEIPTEYCTEDTPDGFSRGSSLSNLSLKSLENFDQKKSFSERVIEQGVGLPCINENETLNITPHANKCSVTTVNKFKLCPQENLYGMKASTFDETPLMFSRCSSLASLNSFDAHSVHSSLVSEYSRRASSVVSPSELPNSPGESPPSPQQRKSSDENGRFNDNDKTKGSENVTCQTNAFKVNEKGQHNLDSLSDNEDENAEDLLSQVMQSAMPKDEKRSTKKAMSLVTATNPPCMKPLYLKASLCQKPCFIPSNSDEANDASFSDTMKTYAVEGTPLELSRSASLSVLTVDTGIIGRTGDKSESYAQFMKYNLKKNEMGSCEDSLHAYCTEQTPITFSRNESLSPLCSKDSPTKSVDISFDLMLEDAINPFRPGSSITSSTPSNKLATSFNKKIDSVDLNSSEIECDAESVCKISENLLSEFDDSSSFSCDSDEFNDTLPSVDHCIKIAMPKSKEAKKKPFFVVLERKGCEGSSFNQSRDVQSSQINSKLDRSSFSEDEDTEVNKTVIYKGPKEVLREELSPKLKEVTVRDGGKSGTNDLSDLCIDFYGKAVVENLESGFLAESTQPKVTGSFHSEKISQKQLKSIDENMQSKLPYLPSSASEKKSSKNILSNFIKQCSLRKKKSSLQKSSPSKDSRKFGISSKKSNKSHQKYANSDLRGAS